MTATALTRPVFVEPGFSVPPSLTSEEIGAAYQAHSYGDDSGLAMSLEGFVGALCDLMVDDDSIQDGFDCQAALAEALQGWRLPAELVNDPSHAIGALILAGRREERRLLMNSRNACQDAIRDWLHRAGLDPAMVNHPTLAMHLIHYGKGEPRKGPFRRLLRSFLALLT